MIGPLTAATIGDVQYLTLTTALFLVGCGFTAAAPDSKDPATDARGPGSGSGSNAVADAPLGPPDGPVDAFDPCAGHDADHDGICDAADDWPCGPRPADPGAARDLRNQPDPNGRLQLADIDVWPVGHDPGGTQRSAVVASGGKLGLSFDFALTDHGCPGDCIDQIEYGLMPVRTGCAYDDPVDKQDGESGSSDVSFTVPTVAAPTLYELRVHVGRNYGCTYNGASTWYGGAPDAGNTIAYVCVD